MVHHPEAEVHTPVAEDHVPVVAEAEVHAQEEVEAHTPEAALLRLLRTHLLYHREVYHGKETTKDGGLRTVTAHIQEMNGSLLTTVGISLIHKEICTSVG